MSFSSLLTSTIMNHQACHHVFLLNLTDPTVTPSSESSLSIEHLTLVNDANVLDHIASTFVTTFFNLLVCITFKFQPSSTLHLFFIFNIASKLQSPTLLPAARPLAGRSFQLFEFQGSAAIQINLLKNLQSHPGALMALSIAQGLPKSYSRWSPLSFFHFCSMYEDVRMMF